MNFFVSTSNELSTRHECGPSWFALGDSLAEITDVKYSKTGSMQWKKMIYCSWNKHKNAINRPENTKRLLLRFHLNMTWSITHSDCGAQVWSLVVFAILNKSWHEREQWSTQNMTLFMFSIISTYCLQNTRICQSAKTPETPCYQKGEVAGIYEKDKIK